MMILDSNKEDRKIGEDTGRDCRLGQMIESKKESVAREERQK
jgi:hypothetical protein